MINLVDSDEENADITCMCTDCNQPNYFEFNPKTISKQLHGYKAEFQIECLHCSNMLNIAILFKEQQQPN